MEGKKLIFVNKTNPFYIQSVVCAFNFFVCECVWSEE